MMDHPSDRLAPFLPFLLPAVLIGYALIVTLVGRMLRARRRRDEANRRASEVGQPWHRWLDEINRRIDAEKKPGAKEKWRE